MDFSWKVLDASVILIMGDSLSCELGTMGTDQPAAGTERWGQTLSFLAERQGQSLSFLSPAFLGNKKPEAFQAPGHKWLPLYFSAEQSDANTYAKTPKPRHMPGKTAFDTDNPELRDPCAPAT